MYLWFYIIALLIFFNWKPSQFSSWNYTKRHYIRECILLCLFILNLIIQNGVKFSWQFLSSQRLFMSYAVCRIIFRNKLLDTSTEIRKSPNHVKLCIPTYQHKMTSSVFLIYNHSKSWVGLLLWRSLVAKVHISLRVSSWKL